MQIDTFPHSTIGHEKYVEQTLITDKRHELKSCPFNFPVIKLEKLEVSYSILLMESADSQIK